MKTRATNSPCSIFLSAFLFPVVLACGWAGSSLAEEPGPGIAKTIPAGEEKTPKTRLLEAGAKLLQSKTPLKGFDIYLVGFHPMKESPNEQMEAHHYCRQVNEDFAQCVLFASNDKNASLNGIEYIISERLFNTLPEKEKKYWHPHDGEILSGQLVAPGIPEVAEKALMKEKMNSYGKTWHLWNTGFNDKPGDELPIGEPMLGWSFNREGEALPGLVERRDEKMKIDTAEKRRQRAELKQLAKPQSGVDDLKGKFGRPTQEIPGVVDQKQATGD
ncbi:MAG TPA: OBAP family protein [Nitrosospira sp.]|nr:OBAP family protein [Nitrosospira sp.]